ETSVGEDLAVPDLRPREDATAEEPERVRHVPCLAEAHDALLVRDALVECPSLPGAGDGDPDPDTPDRPAVEPRVHSHPRPVVRRVEHEPRRNAELQPGDRDERYDD